LGLWIGARIGKVEKLIDDASTNPALMRHRRRVVAQLGGASFALAKGSTLVTSRVVDVSTQLRDRQHAAATVTTKWLP